MAGLVIYLLVLLRSAKKGNAADLLDEVGEEGEELEPLWKSGLRVAGGILALVGGAELLVKGGVDAAHYFGVPERVIGLTLMAVGTSLPELASTVVCCLRGEDDVAVGNVVGSNIFNVLAVLGTTASVHPVSLDTAGLTMDLGTMVMLSLLIPLLALRGPVALALRGVTAGALRQLCIAAGSTLRAPMELSGKQRRFLRAEAHHLEPVVMVGKEGVTESVVAAVSQALTDHELIKVRVLEGAPLERAEVAEALTPAAEAQLVGQIGRVLILYRRHPTKPTIRLPGR